MFTRITPKRALGGTAPPMRGYPRNPRGLPYELQVEAKSDGGIIDDALSYADWLAFKAYHPDDIRTYEEFSSQHKKRDVEKEQRDWAEQVKNNVAQKLKIDREGFFDEVYAQYKKYLDRMSWRSDVMPFKEWYESTYEGSSFPDDFEKKRIERDKAGGKKYDESYIKEKEKQAKDEARKHDQYLRNQKEDLIKRGMWKPDQYESYREMDNAINSFPDFIKRSIYDPELGGLRLPENPVVVKARGGVIQHNARGGLVYKKSYGGNIHRINVDERQNDMDVAIRSLTDQYRNHPRIVEFLQQVNQRRQQPNFDYNRLMRLANQFFGVQRNARGGQVFSTSNIAQHMKSDRY